MMVFVKNGVLFNVDEENLIVTASYNEKETKYNLISIDVCEKGFCILCEGLKRLFMLEEQQ